MRPVDDQNGKYGQYYRDFVICNLYKTILTGTV